MKYEVDLSPDVARCLSARASETGKDVSYLIQIAITQFVADEVVGLTNGGWNDEKEARRGELIDKDIQGKIAPEERIELASLTREGNRHYDQIASRPIEAAIRLHKQLLDRSPSE